MDVMNDTITPPAITISMAKKRMKGERTFERPAVSFPSIFREIPKPILSAERSRNKVEPADKAKLRMVKDVWNFLRIKSLREKEVSLIPAQQPRVFEP